MWGGCNPAGSVHVIPINWNIYQKGKKLYVHFKGGWEMITRRKALKNIVLTTVGLCGLPALSNSKNILTEKEKIKNCLQKCIDCIHQEYVRPFNEYKEYFIFTYPLTNSLMMDNRVDLDLKKYLETFSYIRNVWFHHCWFNIHTSFKNHCYLTITNGTSMECSDYYKFVFNDNMSDIILNCYQNGFPFQK